jgi:hypothetical protein
MEGPSLNNSINNYREKLNTLERTYCPTFFENLPLTIIEFIKGLICFLQKMWGAIINIPIFGAPLHLADDLIQSIWIAGRKRGLLKFLFPLNHWKAFLNDYIRVLSQATLLDPLFLISLLLKPIIWILSAAKTSYRRQIKWKRRVFDLLVARDELEEYLSFEKNNLNHVYIHPSSLIKITRLDDRLRNQSDRIFRTRDLDKLKIFRKPEGTLWWWNPAPPRDRLNWLWQLIIYTCIIGGVSLGADIASRLFNGGDFLGIVAIIGPALLALLLGKEGVSQISSGLEEALNKLDIPKRYWREFILIFAGLLFYIMIIVYQRKSDAAICYYRAGRDLAFSKNEIEEVLDVDVKTPQCSLKFLPFQSQDFLYGLFGARSDRKTIQAESYLKTSSMLDPDNPGVGFALGYLYELQHDFENAKKQYKASARNGSMLGQIRWAKLLLREDNKDSAALAINVLLQNEPSPDIYEKNPASSIAWKVAFATARLRQNRSKEASQQIEEIWDVIISSAQSKGIKQDIMNSVPQNNQSALGFVSSIDKQMRDSGVAELKLPLSVISTIDCVRSRILLKEIKQLKLDSGGNVKKLGQACLDSTDSKDLFQDDLQGQVTSTP